MLNDERELGRQEGVKLGRQEGKEQECQKIAGNMIKNGVALEVIVDCTGLSEEEVMKLKDGV